MNWVEKDPKVYKRISDSYSVSSSGEVIRHTKTGNRKLRTFMHNGSARVSVNGKQWILARLVWETFKGEVPDGYIVQHINGCQTMNDIYNLRLAKKERRMETVNRSKTHKIINMDTGEIYRNAEEASKSLHLHPQVIRSYCRGDRVKRPIYNLKYDDEDMAYERKKYETD